MAETVVEAMRRVRRTPGTLAVARASGWVTPKVIDFAYPLRARDDGHVEGINAYYGSAPKFSYWNGCSAGGRQAMKEAQMFPGDFNGIIAGSPGLDWSGRTAQAVQIAQSLQNEQARLTPAKTQVLRTAVMAACDELDGVKDGLIENQLACKFDPGVLVCKGGEDQPASRRRRSMARLIYSPIVDPKTKRRFLAWRPEVNSDGPTWDGPHRRARPVSITSGIWSSRILSGMFRSSVSPPTWRA